MSILYYSKHCQNCQQLITRYILPDPQLMQTIHFICIDNRTEHNGSKYIILPNGKHMLLPSIIKTVPAIVLLYGEYKVLLTIPEIIQYLSPSYSANELATMPNESLPQSEQQYEEELSPPSILDRSGKSFYSLLDEDEQQSDSSNVPYMDQMPVLRESGKCTNDELMQLMEQAKQDRDSYMPRQRIG